VTFGFAMAEYVARLGKSIVGISGRAGDLRGKLAGAVGAYNATSLLVDDALELERAVLRRLELKPSESATQIVEPEYLLAALLEVGTAFGILANLADDLRHLQRSEIDEVREPFGRQQVGSSTMPQKRNPWNCEHVKSLWKTFAPRILTFFLDQVSEHQRDLTNSASARFVPEFVAGFAAAANRLLRVVQGLHVNRERMGRRLRDGTSDLVMAEAAYVLLAASGSADAHEQVRRLTLDCERRGLSLLDAARADQAIWERLDQAVQARFATTALDFFSHPERYVGQAAPKARAIAERYRALMNGLQSASGSGDA
jgi:adenylosuccinate lyase